MVRLIPTVILSADPPAIPWVDGQLLFLAVTLSAIVAGGWVFYDAHSRDIENPAMWAIVVAFLFLLYAFPGVLALGYYLYLRGTVEQAEQPVRQT